MRFQVASDAQMQIAASQQLDDLSSRYLAQIVPFLSSQSHKPVTVIWAI